MREISSTSFNKETNWSCSLVAVIARRSLGTISERSQCGRTGSAFPSVLIMTGTRSRNETRSSWMLKIVYSYLLKIAIIVVIMMMIIK